MLHIKKRNQKLNIGLTLGMLAMVMIVASVCFDFYYDLNDDVLIKDILAGVHTGNPEGHVIQMLYPIGLFISLFYQIVPSLPWFGYFLCGAHLLCFYLIGIRLVSFTERISYKIMLLATEAILILGLYGYELIYVQYTVVCAMLAGTAAFWLYTIPEKDSKKFMAQASISIFLVWVSFMIRTEMLLLMSPFLAIAGILIWSKEEHVFAKESIGKFGTVILAIFVLVGSAYVSNEIAYSSSGWQKFTDFFDARTEVYDFTWYPSYEGNEEFYESIGIDETNYVLLENYNFGLDHSIDEDTLNSIAQYASSMKTEESIVTTIKQVIYEYKYQTVNVGYPYNSIIFLGYVSIILLAWMNRDCSIFWKIPMMGMFRSVPWFYILYKGRLVDRVIHPMYIVEILILIAVIAMEMEEKKVVIGKTFIGIVLLSGILLLPSTFMSIQAEATTREQYNQVDLALKEYTDTNDDKYYYVDVYSTVTFSEKIFVDVDNTMRNYDLLGGWANRSPFSDAIWEENGFTNFIIKEGQSVEWIQDYYESRGELIEMAQVDTILVEGARDSSIDLEAGQLDIRNLAVYQIVR
ncbi:MAG: hypothetical protein R3Y24_07205 [Eubacteriales bacterium]